MDQRGHAWGAPSTASGAGGATGSSGSAAQKDAGQTFRDPDAGDSGCGSPNKVCGRICVAVDTDVDHCGSCERTCAGPTAACLAGQCACGAGFDYCAGTGCMDVSTDVNNCGACGNVCDPNQFDACVGGQCVAQ